MPSFVLFEGETTGVSAILDGTTTILTKILALITQCTSWILSDPLAIMFFSIMILMLAIHFLHSLVHKFS